MKIFFYSFCMVVFLQCNTIDYYRRLYSGYTNIMIEQKSGKFERARESYLTLEKIRYKNEEYEILINTWDLYTILDEELSFANYEAFVKFMIDRRKKEEPITTNKKLYETLKIFQISCKNETGNSQLSGKKLIKKYFDKEGYLRKGENNLACAYRKILSSEEVFISSGEPGGTTLYYFKDLPK